MRALFVLQLLDGMNCLGGPYIDAFLTLFAKVNPEIWLILSSVQRLGEILGRRDYRNRVLG